MTVSVAAVVVAGLSMAGVVEAHANTSASGGHRHDDALYGTVQTVSSNSFTMLTRDQILDTIDTPAATVYTESGTPVRPTGVAAGETVLVLPARGQAWSDDSQSTITAAAVRILLSFVGGRVTQINGDTLTVQWWDRTFTVNASGATYYVDEQPVSAATLAVNDFILAFGSRSGNTLTAQLIDILGAKRDSHDDTSGTVTTAALSTPGGRPRSGSAHTVIAGTVQSVSGNTIDVSLRNGTTETVLTSGATAFSANGHTTSIAAVTSGEAIRAIGTADSSTELTASEVLLGTACAGNPTTTAAGTGDPRWHDNPRDNDPRGGNDPRAGWHNGGGQGGRDPGARGGRGGR